MGCLIPEVTLDRLLDGNVKSVGQKNQQRRKQTNTINHRDQLPSELMLIESKDVSGRLRRQVIEQRDGHQQCQNRFPLLRHLGERF